VRHELVLAGLRPTPLASYLAALGVLRLVSEQADSGARGWWRNDRFVLESSLDRDGLLNFFLHDYAPSPILAPWGARSGFYEESSERSAREALITIEESKSERVDTLRQAIAATRQCLAELGVAAKSDIEDSGQATLVEALRGRLSDGGVAWLDAVYVLTTAGRALPPILGTGGNEGSGGYSSQFNRAIVVALLQRRYDSELAALLFADQRSEKSAKVELLQFSPEAGLVNPWQVLLCLEGTLVVRGAVTRRLDAASQGRAAFPYTVDPTPAGFSSAPPRIKRGKGAGEPVRAELWLPLWPRPASFPQIEVLFSEARADVGRRRARSALDFARAIASLGVDRGIGGFERFIIAQRRGQANFAASVGRQALRFAPEALLLHDLDPWLGAFLKRADDQHAPEAIRHCARRIEAAIFEVCGTPGPIAMQRLLVALGDAEAVMAASLRWTTDARKPLRPVPPLRRAWIDAIDDGSSELRLATSLASTRAWYGGREHWLRENLEPVAVSRSKNGRLKVSWRADAGRDVSFHGAELTDALNRVMARRLLLAEREGATSFGDRATVAAPLPAIAELIENRLDESRLHDLIRGCLLIDWGSPDQKLRSDEDAESGSGVGAFYALLKLCFPGPSLSREIEIPVQPTIHRLAAAGRGAAAAAAAVRRLRGSGRAPFVTSLYVGSDLARRTAAALVFPVNQMSRALLCRQVLRSEEWVSEAQDERREDT
jgi:CRISPR-associated protein Csx17